MHGTKFASSYVESWQPHSPDKGHYLSGDANKWNQHENSDQRCIYNNSSPSSTSSPKAQSLDGIQRNKKYCVKCRRVQLVNIVL